jgi:hypothetical protein
MNTIYRIRDTYRFADRLFQNYSYDVSHGIQHAMDVSKYAKDILDFDSSCVNQKKEKKEKKEIKEKKEKKELAIVCSLLHDTIDKKYSPETVENRIHRVQQFLRQDLNYSPETVFHIMRVLQTMSYSRTVHNCSVFLPPLWTFYDDNNPQKEKWVPIYHAVRQADLLTSYDIERMLSYKYYQIEEFEKSMDFIIEDTKNMYETRVMSLTEIPNLFPSLWAFNEAKRLSKHCGIMMDILEKERSTLIAPFQFSKYRILDSTSFKNLL